MNNTKNKMNNINADHDDQVFFDLNRQTVKAVKPEKEILTSLLARIPVNSVTNSQLARNTLSEMKDTGRVFIINNFNNIIKSMNNYIKILSGGAIVSVLIIALIFINKADDQTVLVETGTKVEVGGEVLNVDALLTDLDSIDFAYEEPVFDDSDLTVGLINNNDYEIQ